MPDRVLLGDAAEVPSGTLKTFDAGGTSIVVARVGDGFCGVAAKCPHMGGPIGKGRLEGNAVVCPRHGSRFDVCTGAVLEWVPMGALAHRVLTLGRNPTPIETYGVTEEEGKLYAAL